MNIIITDAKKAKDVVKQNPGIYRVVSISSSDDIVQISGAKEILYLVFHDVAEAFVEFAPESLLATEADCRLALDFISREEPCLVHCSAGISRSTAIVLGYLLSKYQNYKEAIDKLFAIRPCAKPNLHILRLMLKIFHREEEYQKIIFYIDEKR